MKKILVYIIVITTIIGFISIYFRNINIDKKNQLAQIQIINENIKKEENKVKNTTLYFVGDMMLARGVKNQVDKNYNGDYSKLFENLGELKNADILFANLEGPISDKGNNVGSIYSFRMDTKTIPAIKNAGFDILSFANNHVGDWNMDAFKDTINRLEESDILVTGVGKNKIEAENPTIIQKNGINFGFIGFSDVGPNHLAAKKEQAGILLASDPHISEIIKKAKEKCDVLIVSFHFGVEYQKLNNERQKNLAHNAIDSGADLIIGHHPHVMENIEIYKDKVIVYSLGNFIFDQYFSKDTMEGMLFKVTFTDNKITETEKQIIKLNRFYQPQTIVNQEENLLEKSNTCIIPKKDYADMSLLNIGKTNGLDEPSYVPKNLVPVEESLAKTKGFCLIKEVKDAFSKMAIDAQKDNIFIKITSAFRSYNTQQTLINEKIKYNKDVYTFMAKPGYSEHQLGTAIDISGSSISYSSASGIFDTTIESKWLKENAYKYGFIMSYPKGKESITGYIYEPWHYRYVGEEIASDITQQNTTIKEYLSGINQK